MSNPFRTAGRSALAALLILATATCTGDPTGPGRAAQVRFTPVLSTGAMGFGLPLDNVTVTVVRPPAETLTVVNAPFDVEDSTLQLDIPVELLAESEDLEVTLQLLSDGTLLFTGTETIAVTTAPGGTTPPAIPLTFVGPGANIAFLNVVPNDTVLTFGDSLTFGANASNALEQPVTQFYLRWSTNSATVPIRSDGLIVAPATRQTIRVAAWTPSGEVDTTDLTFVPVPTQLLKISGDLQTGAVGDTLSSPFVVEVRAADNLPVSGIAVTFVAVTAGGVVLDTVVTTDSVGRASVVAILGGVAQAYSYSATVSGVTPVTFQATASVAAVDVVVISGTPQTDTVGRLLPLPFVVEVRQGGTSTPVPGKMVHWSILYGGGILGADSTLSDSLGRAQISYTLDTILALGSGFAEVLADVVDPGADAIFQVVKRSELVTQVALVTPIPDTVQVGVVFAPQPVVRLRDQYGNNAAMAGVTIEAITNSDYLAPPPPALGPGGIMYPSSAAGVDTAVTDANGVATFSGLMVTGTVGAEVMRFRPPALGGVAHALQNFTLIAGGASSVIAFAGDGQTAFADSAVTIAPEVLVVDFSGNPVAGVQVDFVVTGGGGSVTGGTVITDSLGHATVGSWTLGSTPGPNTLEAQVAGATSATFTATGTPATPTIILELVGTNVVGVGRTATLRVRLTAPDTLGTIVSLTNLNPSVVTLDTASASFGPVDTMRFRVLTGVSEGTSDIIASAPGFIPDTLTVTGSLNLITLPDSSNVAFGLTASLPVQLAQPAPAGGVTISLTSLDTTRVKLAAPTLTFLAGEQLKNATIQGVALGSTQIVAENPNYAPDTTVASTTASLNVGVASLTTFSTLPQGITVEFRSGGSLVPAPAGGVVYTPSPVDPGCVGVPGSDTIPAGQVSTSLSIGWGGVTALPCTSKLYLLAPGMDPDSVNVTVNPPPTLTLATATVGAGLQTSSSLTLQTGTHGGRTATLRVLETGIGLVSKATDSAGVDSFSVAIPNGTSSITWYAQGVEGVLEDTVQLEVSVPGFATDTAPLIVRRPAFELASLTAATTSLSTDDPIWVNIGVPNLGGTFMSAYQTVRTGAGPLAVTFAVAPTGVVQLRDSGPTPDSIKTALIQPGASNTPTSVGTGGVAVDPIGPGLAVVSATIPGFLPLNPSDSVTVTAPGITVPNPLVGAGLQVSAGSTLGASLHGGVSVTIRLLDTAIALLSPNDSTPGVDSLITVFVANNQTNIPYYVQGVEGVISDSVLVEVSAPGFVTDTGKIVVRQSAFELASVATTPTTLSPDDAFWVNVGVPNAGNTFMQQYQNVRAGGTPLTAQFVVTPSTVVTLATGTPPTDTVKTAVVPIRGSNTPTSVGTGGVAVDPLGPGTATLTAQIPGFVGLNAVDTIVVSAPVITLGAATVGAGLHVSHSASLGASGHGGVNVTVKLLAPAVALLAPNLTTAAVDSSIIVALADGQTNVPFVLAGIEGVVEDSVFVEISAPGFVPDTALMRVRRPAIELASVGTPTTTLSADDAFWVNIGVPNAAGTFISQYQSVRFGSSGIPISFVSSTPTVARLVDSSGPVTDTGVITILTGQTNTATSIATGGMGLEPLTTGTTTITASSPGVLSLASATAVVTVNAPGISVSAGNVGSGLQVGGSFTLGASQHGGVDVVVKSSLPGVLQISPNSTTPGSDSIIISLANGQTSGSFYIQGVEDTTGTPSIQVYANGFSDGSAAPDVVQPAIELASVPTSIASGAADDPIWANIGIPNAGHTFMSQYQSVRAGAPALTVTFTSAAPSTGIISNSGGSGASRTAQIAAQSANTPTSVATGGVAFDPLAAGTTLVTATLSGFVVLPAASVVVMVNP